MKNAVSSCASEQWPRRFMPRWLAVIVWMPLVSGMTKADETVTYYYTNPQGSVLATADTSGNLLSSTDYRPYGSQALGMPEDGPGYTGHINDVDSGLVYMQARYYDPDVGRFLSEDPHQASIADLNGFNRYVYAESNPLLKIDPDGQRAVVADGRIYIQPENARVPRVAIPNSVRAEGVATGLLFHSYMSNVSVPLTLSQAGEGLRTNPTPGNDTPASPGGSINNVGSLPPLSANNFVGSFLVQSPNPSSMSNIVVNYTVKGAHSLDEGFVMRYAEKQDDGSVVVRNYGEGNSAAQSGFTGSIPLMMEETAWRQNVKEIVDNAK